MLRIAVDAAFPGADAAAFRAQLEGAALAAKDRKLEYVFTGPKKALARELDLLAKTGRAPGASIIDAPGLGAAGMDPQGACRKNPGCSLMRAAALAAEDSAHALVSAGGVGPLLAASVRHLKRLKGVLRCALACPLPTKRGVSLLIDAGAQVDSKPWHLLQFALMGSLYARHVLRVEGPTLGVLIPPASGLASETVPLLKHLGLHSQGIVSGKDLAAGSPDVIVCDGGIGSTTLGLYGGLYSSYFEMLISELDSSLAGWIGGLIARGTLRGFQDRSRKACIGGAPILGLGGSAVLCRDPRSPEAVAESIRCAAALAESGVNERISERLADAKSDLESARVAG